MEMFPCDILAQWAAQQPEILGLFVFGSFAKGTAKADSDLDLAVELDDTRETELTVLVSNAGRWQTALSGLTGLRVKDIYLRSDDHVIGPVIQVFGRERR